MAYLVLARKYRPQAFSDMTGQEHVVQTLSNALRSGRVAHALLFCGPRGCGKTTTARIVAKALNCERGPTPEPCGVCTPCREITAGTDVDVQEIDAASNTGVDNVRELRESAKYLPARDRFKIFIVDEVHMLSKAAFNAFLKTLEEPPGHVKFLFATTDPQALPDTILSRCQRHNFRLVPLKQISERIRQIAQAEGVTIDDGAVSLVARQAAGSMRDSLSILDQLFSSVEPGAPITEAMAAQALGALDRSVVADLASSLIARDTRGVLQGVARAYDGGHDLKRLTEDLATHLRNLVAARVTDAPLDLPDHEMRALREQASHSDATELARLFDIVHGALFEISRAAQPRHALEMALLRAVLLAPSTSVQSLLGRVDELARKLGVEPPPSGGGGGGGGGGRPSTPRWGGGSEQASARPSWSAPGAGSGGPRAAMAVEPVAGVVAPAPSTPMAPPARHLAAVVADAPAPVPTRPPPVAAPPQSAPPPVTAPAPVPEPARPSPALDARPAPAAVPAPVPAAPAFPAAAAPSAYAAAPAAPTESRGVSGTPRGGPGQQGGNPWERHLSVVPRSGAASFRQTSDAAIGAAVPVAPSAASSLAPASAESVAAPAAPTASSPSSAVSPTASAQTAPPPVAPPAPVAPRPSSLPPALDAETLARWAGVVEFVRGKKRMLGSMLEHARPLSVEQGTLTLGFLRGDLYAQSVASERSTLEPLLGEAWGLPLRLNVIELDAEASAHISSLAEEAERAEREAREERLRGGREHPAIVRAAALLGADIEDVRDLGGVIS